MELRTVKAVVTGGASGLGRATAERLVAAGASVALLDRAASAGADAAKAMGQRAIFTPADVTIGDEVSAALQTAGDRLGGVNVLVNCAGFCGFDAEVIEAWRFAPPTCSFVVRGSRWSRSISASECPAFRRLCPSA